MPPVHQHRPSAVVRPGGILGLVGPNSHVTGPMPIRPVSGPHGCATASHGPAGVPSNARPQGGPVNKTQPSLAPFNSGVHGASQQVHGIRPQILSQKMEPNSTNQNARPINQNLSIRQLQPPQIRQGFQQPP